jgi:hypothetical protein
LDGQDLFLDIDSAYRAAQAMVTDGDGLSVGVSALIKRFHETGWLQSIDQRFGQAGLLRPFLCFLR